MSELKPCPFCGHELVAEYHEVLEEYCYRHPKVKLETSDGQIGRCPLSSMDLGFVHPELWNRRAEPQE